MAGQGTIDLDEALSRAGDGAFVIDAGGRIVFWNRSAERILGHASRDVIGHAWRIAAGRAAAVGVVDGAATDALAQPADRSGGSSRLELSRLRVGRRAGRPQVVTGGALTVMPAQPVPAAAPSPDARAPTIRDMVMTPGEKTIQEMAMDRAMDKIK